MNLHVGLPDPKEFGNKTRLRDDGSEGKELLQISIQFLLALKADSLGNKED
jgi:hypothetical protein